MARKRKELLHISHKGSMPPVITDEEGISIINDLFHTEDEDSEEDAEEEMEDNNGN